jgi:hypothetical protein
MELERFWESGYVVLPDILPPGLVSRLTSEADWWVDSGTRADSIGACLDPDRRDPPAKVELELQAHGELATFPPLLTLLCQLTGGSFVFHHLHSDRLEPERPGKAWHHDYERGPRTDTRHIMVHILYYLDGIDTDMASLVVLPGSHRTIGAKDALAHLGTDELAGEVIIDSLPPGSAVVLHSAQLHARRPRAGRPSRRPRYFTDASYCQTGTLWPPVKPYWRLVLEKGRQLRWDRERWPELFAERHFTEYVRPAR